MNKKKHTKKEIIDSMKLYVSLWKNAFEQERASGHCQNLTLSESLDAEVKTALKRGIIYDETYANERVEANRASLTRTGSITSGGIFIRKAAKRKILNSMKPFIPHWENYFENAKPIALKMLTPSHQQYPAASRLTFFNWLDAEIQTAFRRGIVYDETYATERLDIILYGFTRPNIAMIEASLFNYEMCLHHEKEIGFLIAHDIDTLIDSREPENLKEIIHYAKKGCYNGTFIVMIKNKLYVNPIRKQVAFLKESISIKNNKAFLQAFIKNAQQCTPKQLFTMY